MYTQGENIAGKPKYRIAGKSGGLAVYFSTAKIMAIPQHTTKFKSANTV